MGDGAQSTERRVFVGGMPFSYEVTLLPAQRKQYKGAVTCHSM